MDARDGVASEAGPDEEFQDVSATVHPSAIVHPGADLGEGVEIGPFCEVGPNVVLEAGVRLHARASVIGHTRLGEGCELFEGAVLGGLPQILGERSSPDARLVVGPRGVFREHTTVSTGSSRHSGLTQIGADAFLMQGTHIGHDCRLGDHCVLANGVMVGGHVVLGDQVWIGGMAALHQFTHVGDHAFIAGGAIVVGDVVPFGAVVGNRAALSGLNLTGLKRRGFDRARLHTLRRAYKALFEAPGPFSERVDTVRREFPGAQDVADLLAFIEDPARTRELCQPRRA